MMLALKLIDEVDDILLRTLNTASLDDIQQYATASWHVIEQVRDALFCWSVVVRLALGRCEHDGPVIVDDIGVLDLMVEAGRRHFEIGVSGHLDDSFHENSEWVGRTALPTIAAGRPPRR